MGEHMIPKECRRLIEMDFPIAVVSKRSAREKEIRHGHPSILHLWWARRPLAARRAVLMGLLLPNPVDADCPPGLRDAATRILAPLPVALEPDDDGLRKAILSSSGSLAHGKGQPLRGGREKVLYFVRGTFTVD